LEITITEKECSICGIVKPITEFYKQQKKRKNGTQWIYYNPECKDCSKKRAMKWEKAHPDKALKNIRTQAKKRKNIMKQYRKDNRERIQETFKTWQENNRNKTIEYNRKRTENKTHNISKSEWAACKEYFNNSCAYCGVIEKEAKQTQGQYLHKEHVDHNGENDLSNCVPACRSCNSNKWVFNLSDWYNDSNENFTYERLEKIQQWLNNDYKLYIEHNDN
jgi:hypothetical protein